MPTPRLEFTQAFVDSLIFTKQPVVKNGKVVRWIPTPKGTNDWMVQDVRPQGSRQPSGLLIRLSPGSATWVVRRRLAGNVRRRAMGSCRRGEGGQYLTLKEALQGYANWLDLMASGRDPMLERKKQVQATAATLDNIKHTMRKAFADYVVGKSERSADTTTTDRLKVGRWLDKSPLFITPVIEVNREVVKATFQPLVDLAKGKTSKRVGWGPKRPGSIQKMYIYTHAAWKRAVELGHLDVKGDPFHEWEQDVKLPELFRKTSRLNKSDEKSPLRETWLKALVKMWRHGHQHEQDQPLVSLLADYYILVLLWGTRLTETCSIRWENMDEENDIFWLEEETTKTSALTGKPLTLWVKQILARRRQLNKLWRPDSPFVFPSPRRGQHLSNPRKALDRLKAETNIKLTTHDLRRTFADDVGKSIKAIRDDVLQITGVALSHAKGSKITQEYLLSLAPIYKPLYQEREDRLRKEAGLEPLGQPEPPAAKAETDDASAVQQVLADPALLQQVLAKHAANLIQK